MVDISRAKVKGVHREALKKNEPVIDNRRNPSLCRRLAQTVVVEVQHLKACFDKGEKKQMVAVIFVILVTPAPFSAKTLTPK